MSTTNRNFTFSEFVVAYAKRIQSNHERQGQAYAEELRGSINDPFHRDIVPPEMWEEVEKRLS
jgi:hypothetical protein